MLKVCKFSIAMLFINLYVIYTITGRYIPMGTLVFGMLACIAMLIDIYTEKSNTKYFARINTEMITLTAFLVFAYVTSPFALDMTTTIDGCFEFLQKLMMLFVMYYICCKDNSLDFPAKLFLFIAVATGLYTLVTGGVVNNEELRQVSDRVSLSANVSENALGNIMVLGSFCAMYLYKGRHWYSLSILVGLLSLFVVIIAKTGSRKSIIAIIILLGMYLLFSPKDRKMTVKSIVAAVSVMIVLIVGLNIFYPTLEQSALYERLFDADTSAKANASNEGRKQFYVYAWNDFLSAPFTGLGLKGYAFKHGSYTHSAYAEVLACTGIFGTILYFISYIKTTIKLYHNSKDKSITGEDKRNCILIMCFFIVFLYIGIGIGHLYDNVSMVELGIFFAAGSIYGCDTVTKKKRRLKKTYG